MRRLTAHCIHASGHRLRRRHVWLGPRNERRKAASRGRAPRHAPHESDRPEAPTAVSKHAENDDERLRECGRRSSCTKSGGVLLSQGVYPQVPSALTGLTSVFGMGTGVTLSPWPPKSVVNEVRCTSRTPEQARAVQIQALGRLVPVG